MSRFDEVLDQTVRAVETAPFAARLASVTVIRDLKGRVRLLLEFRAGAPSDWDTIRADLARRLAGTLGPYWGGQVWHTGGRADAVYRAMEEAIRTTRQPWDDVPTALAGALRWYKLERVFSKSSWLMSTAAPPWTADDPANPAIISFYSFKGGVGRTMAAAATAALMARTGHRVVALDLDLEAPGLGMLLLGDITPPDDGVVDYLLDRLLTGQRPPNLDLYMGVQNRREIIGDGEPVRVFTAGRLTNTFPEKIARLDFEGFVTQSPNPLAELLLHIRAEYAPEFILLDVRAGLHDVGGLSLNGMSHLDILFGLDTPQSWSGLRLVLHLLGGARQHRRDVLLVHAMVTPPQFDPTANARFRERGFDLFREEYYREDEDIPDVDDPNAPYGLPIRYRDELLNAGRLADVMSVLTDEAGDYVRLVNTIGSYVQRETR